MTNYDDRSYILMHKTHKLAGGHFRIEYACIENYKNYCLCRLCMLTVTELPKTEQSLVEVPHSSAARISDDDNI